MIEMDYQIFFQQFVKWLKPVPSLGKICRLCRNTDGFSNLGQRGKDAVQWHSSGCVTAVWDAHLPMTPEKIWSMTMMGVRMKRTLQSSDLKADPRFQRKPHLLCRFLKQKRWSELPRGCKDTKMWRTLGELPGCPRFQSTLRHQKGLLLGTL